MPYIKQEQRTTIDSWMGALDIKEITEVGQFNYIVTKLACKMLGTHGLTYDSFNAILGALECVKQELYRRLAVPYENLKRMDNGDLDELEWLENAVIHELQNRYIARVEDPSPTEDPKEVSKEKEEGIKHKKEHEADEGDEG